MRKLLAGLLAGGMLVSAAYAEADPQSGKGGKARAVAATAAKEPAAEVPKKVSPFATANRQRLAAASGDRAHAKKHPPGQSLTKPLRALRH